MKFNRIDNNKYYKLDTIIDVYKNFNKGCKTNAKIIEKQEIPDNEYIYARLNNDNKWIKTDGKSKKFDKIFIDKTWFDQNYQNDKEKLEEIKDDTEDAPKIIKLKNNEKFYDEDNNPIEIEVRGEREEENCYFKVADVSKGFNMDNLQHSIIDKKGIYQKNEDYIYFYCVKERDSPKNKTKKLFLTYNGILRVLYSSKKQKTKPFINWATKTLFRAHLGTQQSKNKLASTLLGIDLASINKFLSASPFPISVIYFIFVGYVKDIRDKFNLDAELDDGSMMCRYGYTNDLNRRCKEHKEKFGNQIELLMFSIVDPLFLSKAETSLDRYFESTNSFLELEINGNNETEVVLITKSELKNIKEQYELIGSKYEGKMNKQSEFIKDLINKHEKELMIEKHQKELMIEKHQKELIIEKHEKELLKKDNNILQQQLEIVQLKAK